MATETASASTSAPATATSSAPNDEGKIKSGDRIRRIAAAARKAFGKGGATILFQAIERNPDAALEAFGDLALLLERGWDPSASVMHPDDPSRCMAPSAFIDGALRAGKGTAKVAREQADRILGE